MTTRTIYRYPLDLVDGEQIVQTPANPIVRFVGDRPGASLDGAHQVNAWIEHDIDLDGANDPTATVSFYVVPTGQTVPEETRYVGSVTTAPFIWHVYRTTTIADVLG